ALTFVWSGWLMFNVNQPCVFASLVWMPPTVLCVDLVAQGRKWAPWALAVTVGCQALLGVHEQLLHGLYAGGIFALGRLAPTIRHRQPSLALRRAALIVLGVAAGMLLGAVQILPMMELLGLSGRAPVAMSFEQISAVSIGLWEFVSGS